MPKGWPAEGLTPAQCAAQEALEEAGVEGNVAEQPLGSFPHHKESKSGETILCTVYLFPMEVTGHRQNWPEKHIREIRWCSVGEATARVNHPNLRGLIMKFVKASGELADIA